MDPIPKIRLVKAKHEKALLGRPNVVGVGIGYRVVNNRRTDEISVLVLVRQKLPLSMLPAEAVVPAELDGARTDVVEVGEIRALQERTDRWRPAPGGVSVGHYRITAGTFGSVVVDRTTGARLILSNNHVLANSNDATPGDAILQPGPADGGSAGEDVIAHLERFCPIEFSVAPPICGLANAFAGLGNFLASLVGSSHRLLAYQVHPSAVNQADAAVARPVEDGAILDEILEIGVVSGTTEVELGMQVRKSGRTTGLTTGEVTVVDATVDVSYGIGRTARFEHQFLTGPMSQGGDSGSLLVAGEALLAVGLLFAGSNQTTVYNPIQTVLDCLNVNFGAAQTASQSAAPQSAGRTEPGVTMEQAQAVKRTHEAELMSKPNVVGVGVGQLKKGGQGTGQIGLVVMVRRKIPRSQLADEEVIPAEIEGVPVDVQETGELRAQ